MGFGGRQRLRRGARWAWRSRHTLSDLGWALVSYPFVAMFTVVPASGLGTGLYAILAPASPWSTIFLMMSVALVAPGSVSAAILFRRSRPQWLWITAIVWLLVFGNIVATMVAIYSYAAWFAARRKLAAGAALSLAVLCLTYVAAPPTTLFLLVLLAIVTPLALGLWAGVSRQLVANLRDRAERLKREQHLMAERAITGERTRIAREMHDVVAHRVSLMVLHAGGLEVSAADEGTAKTAEVIRTTGREALSELREILGVLRDDAGEDASAPRSPQPTLADVGLLLEGAREAGLLVRMETAGPRRTVPPNQERTAYRVIQESLTNVAKHAPGSQATVGLDYRPFALGVTVYNAVPVLAVREELTPSSGYGLAGLRERVQLVGGQLAAGPCADGGWRVHAELPVGHEPPVYAERPGTGGD